MSSESIQLGVSESSSPYLVRDGVFGTTFKKDGEQLFLRMELVTEENSSSWSRFATVSKWVANNHDRGVLSSLLSTAGTERYPNYETIKKCTGFTEEEFKEFTKKAIHIKEKTQDKIVELIKANGHIAFMSTGFTPEKPKYIVYATKNPDFSIQDITVTIEDLNLKNFIEAYNDILISVGSNFSEEGYFHNRGIARNPHWVFEDKYSGLSMLLHGFSAAVAEKYFPGKKTMRVRPIGSMQSIIVKNLLPGEGYVEVSGEKIELTTLIVSPTDPEGPLNYIQTSALTRIYRETIKRMAS